ncbi:LysE family translocator [Pseudoduganella sp. HUAS MS19]
MDASTLMLFVPACFALNMAPGPNNLLSVSNATRYGFRRSCLAGAGRLVAFAGMIALASAGLAAVLHTSELLFYVIKTFGAIYLFYLAWQLWHAEAGGQAAGATPAADWWQLARQEFFVAAGNPKAILIFTAFLPQFVDPAGAVGAQFFVLGVLFLLLEVVALAAYAWMGARMQKWFAQPRGKVVFNRTCAGLLAGAGAGLLFSRRA